MNNDFSNKLAEAIWMLIEDRIDEKLNDKLDDYDARINIHDYNDDIYEIVRDIFTGGNVTITTEIDL